MWFTTIRAQIFTLLFILLQILLQQSDWQGRKSWVLAWAVLYVVWLNMHAGFVVGVAMMFLHVVERWLTELGDECSIESVRKAYFKLWHHLLLPPILAVGLQINPWGVLYGPYLLRAIAMERPTILEWQPLWMTHRDDVLPKHNQFYSAELGWQSVLNEYSADLILVQANSPVRKSLGKVGTYTEGWHVVYEDPVFSLYANVETLQWTK